MINSLTLIPLGIALAKYATDEEAGVLEAGLWGIGGTFALMVAAFFLGVSLGIPLGR